MESFFEFLKVLFLGIVEGITEWLPISSTGHMLLVDEFLHLNVGPHPEEFARMFIDVIQLGAILAVVLVFFRDMWPFGMNQNRRPTVKKDVFSLWFKVVVACVPGAVATILCKGFVDEHLNTPYVIAAALILYGAAFLVIETRNKNRTPKVAALSDISYLDALLIGLFQVLSIIPGTSRSGSTIIGALIIGVSRKAAAEFTFFLAVPVMFGLSALDLIGYIHDFGIVPIELVMIGFGMLIAFAVSLFVIRFLMNYIRRHDFKVFGWYRIVLGAAVILYFALRG